MYKELFSILSFSDRGYAAILNGLANLMCWRVAKKKKKKKANDMVKVKR